MTFSISCHILTKFIFDMLWNFIFQEYISIYILASQNIETASVWQSKNLGPNLQFSSEVCGLNWGSGLNFSNSIDIGFEFQYWHWLVKKIVTLPRSVGDYSQ
jgi:hypothetical protein